MGFAWGNRFLATLVVSVMAIGMVGASQQPTSVEDGKRKVKFRTNPQYSQLAHTMHLSGKVKIEVVIAADGHVKTGRALGGHPLLVQSCLDAVKDWKFEAGPEETTQIVEFEFKE
jgi:outer membrane biosynthesis protein TonB